MNKKELKYLELSDIHLGHARNTAPEIINNLTAYFHDFKKDSPFVELDYIFIAGDLFDKLLDLSDPDTYAILDWLNRLAYFCSRHDIALRVLEGTPSHDWKQSYLVKALAGIVNTPLDFKYIDTLFIEHHERHDLWILYIPDEWTDNAETTYEQVLQLLKDNNISQVDIGMFHGYFTYQCKIGMQTTQAHDPEAYLSLVKHFINIGHIHTFTTYKRIIASGSFDRLSHGEEEPKGAVLCTIRDNNDDEFLFIENKKAKIFKTITLKSNDIDQCYLQIDKILAKIPHNSYIRIKAKKNHPIYSAFEEFKLRYVMYYFSKKSEEDEDEDKYLLVTDVLQSDVAYTPITLTPQNIVLSLMTEIRAKHQLNVQQDQLLTSILESNNA